jgi:hypothetical protein
MTLAFAVVFGVAGLSTLLMARAARYRHLSNLLSRTLAIPGLQLETLSGYPAFNDRIVSLANILSERHFCEIYREIELLVKVERTYLPSHKKGGAIAYGSLIESAPAIIRLYHSYALRKLVSEIAGVSLRPTPLEDQSSVSVLVYDQAGDHINWHYDHNFYRGRHFTVLLPIVNHGRAEGSLSHAQLLARIGGNDRPIDTARNSLIIFEGARVLHKVTPIKDGERRILISMTFCEDTRASWSQEVARRLKDTAFFGVRALWT